MEIEPEPHIMACVNKIPESESRLLIGQMLQRLSMLDGMDVLRSNYPLVAAHWQEPGVPKWQP